MTRIIGIMFLLCIGGASVNVPRLLSGAQAEPVFTTEWLESQFPGGVPIPCIPSDNLGHCQTGSAPIPCIPEGVGPDGVIHCQTGTGPMELHSLCPSVSACVIQGQSPGIPTGSNVVPDRSWHLLTQTFGGQISLLKDLTQHECEFVRARALREPATEKEKEEAERAAREREAQQNQRCPSRDPLQAIYCSIGTGTNTYGRMSTSSDISTAECFQ